MFKNVLQSCFPNFWEESLLIKCKQILIFFVLLFVTGCLLFVFTALLISAPKHKELINEENTIVNCTILIRNHKCYSELERNPDRRTTCPRTVRCFSFVRIPSEISYLPISNETIPSQNRVEISTTFPLLFDDPAPEGSNVTCYIEKNVVKVESSSFITLTPKDTIYEKRAQTHFIYMLGIVMLLIAIMVAWHTYIDKNRSGYKTPIPLTTS